MKKLITLAIFLAFVLTAFSGCDYDVDEGILINEQLVYTLVGEGEDAYYIVGACKDFADLGLTESSAMSLNFEEKSLQLGVYGGNEKTVTVPNEYLGKPVKGIGAMAFYMCEATEIILPETIEFVSDSAMRNCLNLQKVTFGSEEAGSALNYVGKKVFMGAEKLSSLFLYGDTVPEVGTLDPQNDENPFSTTWYPAVVVPNDMVDEYKKDDTWVDYSDYVASVNGVYVNGLIIEEGVLIKYTGSQTEVTISEIVKVIGKYSFKNTAVTQVTVTSQVEEIGRQAFCDCLQLTAVLFNDDSALKIIGNNAFDGCVNLKTATFPAGMTIIKDEAFSDCTALDTVYLLGTSVTNVFINAFENCVSLKDVFFVGTEEDFANIKFSRGNECFTNAQITYGFNNSVDVTE